MKMIKEEVFWTWGIKLREAVHTNATQISIQPLKKDKIGIRLNWTDLPSNLSTAASQNRIIFLRPDNIAGQNNKSQFSSFNSLKMQQAVLVTEIGKPLTLESRAIPEPTDGQVQIKVLSTMRVSSFSALPLP
jgi:hypothetical protein